MCLVGSVISSITLEFGSIFQAWSSLKIESIPISISWLDIFHWHSLQEHINTHAWSSGLAIYFTSDGYSIYMKYSQNLSEPSFFFYLNDLNFDDRFQFYISIPLKPRNIFKRTFGTAFFLFFSCPVFFKIFLPEKKYSLLL